MLSRRAAGLRYAVVVARRIRKRRYSASPYSADLWNRSISSPPFASITRCDAMLSASLVRSTYGSPSPLACGSSHCNARVAYPRRRFHGTTEYPMCPRQYGGRSVVPGCQRKPIAPQNSPSHIHCEYPGRRGTVEPSGRITGGPLASRSICSERKCVGSFAIRANSSTAACGRRFVWRPALLKRVNISGQVLRGRPNQFHWCDLHRLYASSITPGFSCVARSAYKLKVRS